jgi:hypothetical protein
MAQQAAGDAVARSAVTSFRAQMRGAAQVGEQRSTLASTGADVNAGSAFQVQQDTRLMTQMDEDIIRNNAAREAYGYNVKAQEEGQQGAYAMQTARNQELGSFIGGIGKVVGIAGPRLGDIPTGSEATIDSPNADNAIEA